MAALCIDCGVDTAPNDDRRRRRGARKSEYYMVHDAVWAAAGMSKQEPMLYGENSGDFLCIGCLERRLGRTLTNFTAILINRPDRWHSGRLADRLARKR
jgi:hypothetical protein